MIPLKDLLIIMAGTGTVDVALALSWWLNGPEYLYRQTNGSGSIWFWLDVLHMPRTEQNCLVVAQWYFGIGIVLSTAAGIAAFIYFVLQ